MRTFFRRLRHRDAVHRHLEALLVLYPPKRQFEADFPALRTTIADDFQESVPPPVSALAIAARILESFVDQLQDAEKEQALAALIEGGRERFGGAARQRIAKRPAKREATPGDRVAFVTALCGGALFMAARMQEEGTLRRDEYAGFARTIGAALGAAEDALERAFSR